MKKRSMFNGAVAGLALAAGVTGCVQISDGDRVGTITKISHKGITPGCKSWEGELAMDNFSARGSGKSTTMSNSFEFSVTDPAIVQQIQDAQDSGERVKLHYNQLLLRNPCTSDTNYYVTSVKPVTAAAQPPAPKL